MPQPLSLRIRLHQRNIFCGAAGESQIIDGDLINGEHRRGGAELGAHVADGRSVCQWNLADSRAVKLNELAHDTVTAEHVCNGQHDVGCCDRGRNCALEFEADNLGNKHRNGLPEHRRLGFDTADTPAKDTESIDHRGVRIRSDTRIGERDRQTINIARIHNLREVFDVDLVNNSGSRWDDLKVVERRLSPSEELITLAISFVLDFYIALESVFAAEQVRDDRVVDHEFRWCEGVDFFWVAAQFGDRFTHRGEVNDARHSGEVLHDNTGRRELDFGVGFLRRVPISQCRDVLARDVCAVFGAQQIFQKNLEAEWQTLVPGDRFNTINRVVILTN